MPPETQYEEDESELEAALAAPRAVKPVAPDAGTEYADDAELDAALARPADISQQVRSEAARKVEGSVSEEDFDAASKGSKVTELPVQHIEGTVPKKPWYERFIPNGERTRAFAHGLGAGATANWGEEGAAGLMSLLPQPEDPQGIPREYAAGSQYADTHNVLENENRALREAHPVAFGVGEMAGAAPAAIASGGTGPMSTARLMGTAAAQGALAGSGYDTENRARGAAVGAGAGAATAGMLKGASQGLDKMAQNAIGKADELIVQTFMTPAQRAAYQKAHGLDSMRQLGADAREAGLFKTAILPPRAATVAKRANEVMAKSGDQISGFEDGLIQQGIDPQVNVKPIADELRGTADEMNSLPAIGAADDAGTLAKQADLLEARRPDQPFTPVRENIPFSEASKLKRLLGKQINWNKNPHARQIDQGTEEARKLTWRGTAQQIDKALANDPNVDPAKLAEYGQAKKNYSAAATAFDPAVSMMERENEMGLGARDLMAATAFGGGNPLVGGLASMANKNMAGAVPAMQSNNLRRFAGTLSGPGVLSPKNPGAVRKIVNKAPGLSALLRGQSRVTGIADANNAVDLVRSFGGDTQKANDEVKKQLNEIQQDSPK